MSTQPAPASYQTARIIHAALFAGQAIFLFIVIFLIKDTLGFELESGNNMIVMICYGMAVPLLFIAPFIEKNMHQGKNDSEITPTQRQTGQIIKYALWEGPCLFSIVVMLVTKSLITLPIALLVLALFILNAPKPEQYNNS